MFIATQYDQYAGSVVGNGHCVAYVQKVSGAPHTSAWRAGTLVRGGNHPNGTAIATFNSAGCYANATNGASHAAILIAENADGLLVMDQWVGQAVHQRTIRSKGGAGKACDDADRYYVVTDADAPAVGAGPTVV